MEREIGGRIGAVGAVLRSLYRTVLDLDLDRSIFVPILTYGHEG